MSALKTSTLGELVTIAGGGTPTRSNPDFYGGTIPWVTPKDMKSWEITGAQVTLTQSGVENSSTRVVPINSILIVVRSGVLKHTIPVGLNRVPVAINQDMKALQCREGIDANYLARFVKASSPIILQWVRATTADNFPIDKLRNLAVPLPPLAEQRRIAEVLDRAEALRAKRRAALAQLDFLTQSLFLDIFGDTRRDRTRWPTVPLEEIVRETKLGLVRGSHEFGPEFPTPYVRMNAITRNGELDLGNVQRTHATEAEIEAYRLEPGDFLFNTRNSKELVGKTALYRGEGLHLFNNNLMRVRFTAKADAVFVAAAFKTAFVQHELNLRKSGTTNVFAIYYKDLRSLPLPLPPLPLQREFARRVKAVETLKAAQRSSLAELDALFASLQHRAFRGEL